MPRTLHWRHIVTSTDAFLSPLRGGPIDIVQSDGSTEHFVWETGKPFWLPASPPNTMHSDVNKGPGTIEVVVVELKKDK